MNGDYALDNTMDSVYDSGMANEHNPTPSGKNQKGDLTLIQLAQRFSTEEAAREYFEKLRWPNGPVCPHCGNASQERIYRVTPNPEKKIRAGLYKCAECLNGFTVTVGTISEDSHIPLNKSLIGFYMMCASMTQVSALQLQRQLEIVSYRSAWFMCHRIRFALLDIMPTDKVDGTVEADEPFSERKPGMGRHIRATRWRSSRFRARRARAFSVTRQGHWRCPWAIAQLMSPKPRILHTDKSHLYKNVGKSFASHDTVNHSQEEYARRDVSGRLRKHEHRRGIFRQRQTMLDGTHHQVSAKHLPLYLAELDYQYRLTRRDGWRAHDDWHPEDRRQATAFVRPTGRSSDGSRSTSCRSSRRRPLDLASALARMGYAAFPSGELLRQQEYMAYPALAVFRGITSLVRETASRRRS